MDRTIVVEKTCLDAYLEYIIQRAAGKDKFEIIVTKYRHDARFGEMLKRNDHKYEVKDGAFYIG